MRDQDKTSCGFYHMTSGGLLFCHFQLKLKLDKMKTQQWLVLFSSIPFLLLFSFVFVDVKLAWSKDVVKSWCSLCEQRALEEEQLKKKKKKVCAVDIMFTKVQRKLPDYKL